MSEAGDHAQWMQERRESADVNGWTLCASPGVRVWYRDIGEDFMARVTRPDDGPCDAEVLDMAMPLGDPDRVRWGREYESESTAKRVAARVAGRLAKGRP